MTFRMSSCSSTILGIVGWGALQPDAESKLSHARRIGHRLEGWRLAQGRDRLAGQGLCERSLCRILKAYARYYNEIRTHRSLDKDAPVSRPVQRTGIITSRAILGGLHHHYVRV